MRIGIFLNSLVVLGEEEGNDMISEATPLRRAQGRHLDLVSCHCRENAVGVSR